MRNNQRATHSQSISSPTGRINGWDDSNLLRNKQNKAEKEKRLWDAYAEMASGEGQIGSPRVIERRKTGNKDKLQEERLYFRRTGRDLATNNP
jgi:hypothetical protein